MRGEGGEELEGERGVLEEGRKRGGVEVREREGENERRGGVEEEGEKRRRGRGGCEEAKRRGEEE